MERHKFPAKTAFDALLYLPIIIPDIAMAVMLLLFFVMTKTSLSLVTIIISHVAFNISFVAVVVRARLVGLDGSLEEAAQDPRRQRAEDILVRYAPAADARYPGRCVAGLHVVAG